jgi:hypothetical protein
MSWKENWRNGSADLQSEVDVHEGDAFIESEVNFYFHAKGNDREHA